MVPASVNVARYSYHIRTPYGKPRSKPTVSVVICTYGRPESLNETLESLEHQSFKDFECILVTEKGDLSELRDIGLRSSYGGIVSFIDDDVYCSPTWLRGVVEAFDRKSETRVVGVSGPTIITKEFRNNRDLFKYKWPKLIYDYWFIGKRSGIPGSISECGAPSTSSNEESCRYEGRVDYLEACNMSVKRKEALDVGGFSYDYRETSEWCEVDLALRLGRKGVLYFSQDASLFHRPSKAGIYSSRLRTDHRWENFKIFQKRWVKPSLQRTLYWAFIWCYLTLKAKRMI